MRLLIIVFLFGLTQAANAEQGFCDGELTNSSGQTSPFFGFEFAMTPLMAKRLCGTDVTNDKAFIRRFYQDVHGCSPESEIGAVIELVLEHETPQEFLIEFGISDREQVPTEMWDRLCAAAEKIETEEILFEASAERPDLDEQFSDFLQSIEAIRKSQRQ